MKTQDLAKFKHVLITGASSGIGEALALHYAEPGRLLSLTGRDEKRLQDVAQKCCALGAEVETALIDVTHKDEMEKWIVARDECMPVDLVIANAGVSGGTGGPLEGEPASQVRHIFDVNVNGVFNTIDPLLSRMIKRNKGHIALMSSLAGFRGWPGAPAYCASKAAVKVFGEGLRGALSDKKVHVSVICPGFVISRMTDANSFKMPFLMKADKAAWIIARGLGKNAGRIAFPLRALLFAWFFAALPDSLAQKILKLSPDKAANHRLHN